MPRVNGGSPGRPTSRTGSKSAYATRAVTERIAVVIDRGGPAGAGGVAVAIGRREVPGAVEALDREIAERGEAGAALG